MRSYKRYTDVAVVGGGASGLAAAVELGMKAPDLEVLVIEKMDAPGRKLRATGSGRCNITNTSARGFSLTMEFFRRIGLVTRAYENGLVYPYSESAADVVKLLTDRAGSLGSVFACGEEVTAIRCGGPKRFETVSIRRDKNGEHHITTYSDFVILASGGKAGPTYGTTGDGYRLARELGHSIVTPVPALTGIECGEWGTEAHNAASLGGTRSAGVVSLYKKAGGEAAVENSGEALKIFEEAGEIQFTRYGLSGICVFNMTRFMRFNRAAGESIEDYTVRADLFPDGDIREYIKDRKEGAFANESAAELLCAILKKPLADYVIGRASCPESRCSGSKSAGVVKSELPEEISAEGKMLRNKAVAALTDEETEAIARSVHSLEFHPSALRGWKDAQVSMGGVSLSEIDEETSESKLVKGLYITGELADRDFPCGGFNLNNAWLTGLAAADSIAAEAASE